MIIANKTIKNKKSHQLIRRIILRHSEVIGVEGDNDDVVVGDGAMLF